MPYRNLDFKNVQPRTLWQTFAHLDGMLADLYVFYRIPPSQKSKHLLGSGKFTTTLVLCCLIDSLATDVWPFREKHAGQAKAFKCFLHHHLPEEVIGGGVTKDRLVKVLYQELRNPLVHAAGRDDPTEARPKGWTEPVIAKWKPVPSRSQIDKVLFREKWRADWPILSMDSGGPRNKRYLLCNVALFWAVLRMATVLLESPEILSVAGDFHRKFRRDDG